METDGTEEDEETRVSVDACNGGKPGAGGARSLKAGDRSEVGWLTRGAAVRCASRPLRKRALLCSHF